MWNINPWKDRFRLRSYVQNINIRQSANMSHHVIIRERHLPKFKSCDVFWIVMKLSFMLLRRLRRFISSWKTHDVVANMLCCLVFQIVWQFILWMIMTYIYKSQLFDLIIKCLSQSTNVRPLSDVRTSFILFWYFHSLFYTQQDKKYYPTAEEVYGPEVEVQRLMVVKCLYFNLSC